MIDQFELHFEQARPKVYQWGVEAMPQMEKDMLERRRQFDKEHEEYKARLARERGRGAFGATYTGD